MGTPKRSKMNSMKVDASSITYSSEYKFETLKKLNKAMQDFLHLPSEDHTSLVSRYLQALSVTIDLTIFDPYSCIVTSDFYVTLYNLMQRLEPTSQIMWYCVDVLSNACRNNMARKMLMEYQFIPVLSKLLSDQLTTTKKIFILRVMQELSCGIKISWQIPHLSHLITNLVNWLQSGNDEIKALSLGVIANLCYKNLPVMYTLQRTTDIKELYRICLPLEGPVIEVQVRKLLLIVQDGNSEGIHLLIEPTFKSIKAAYFNLDAVMLRQIIVFFLEVMKKPYNLQILKKNENLQFKKIIEMVENNSTTGDRSRQDPDCIAIILEFLLLFVEEKIHGIEIFYPNLIRLAIEWIHIDQVSSQALRILKSIALNTEKQNKILEPLVKGLPVYLVMLNQSVPANVEHNKKMEALFGLLKCMLTVESVRNTVLKELRPDLIQKFYVPIIEGSVKIESTPEATNLYIYGLDLVNDLENYDKDWLPLQLLLMGNKQIQYILARALYTSSNEIREIILNMTKKPNFPTKIVASYMGDNQAMSLVKNEHIRQNSDQEIMSFQCLNNSQNQKLEETLATINEKLKFQNGTSISTSEVMQLYEFKIASMSHSERSSLASIEALSERCMQLQHRNTQMDAELTKLHENWFNTQQLLDETSRSLGDVSTKLEAEKGRYKVSQSQLHNCEKHITELKDSLSRTAKDLEQMTNEKLKWEDQYNSLQEITRKLEENCTRLEKNVQKKDEQIKKANSVISDYNTQLNESKDCLANLKEKLRSKEEENEEIRKELIMKRNIIETINKVANSSQF